MKKEKMPSPKNRTYENQKNDTNNNNMHILAGGVLCGVGWVGTIYGSFSPYVEYHFPYQRIGTY